MHIHLWIIGFTITAIGCGRIGYNLRVTSEEDASFDSGRGQPDAQTLDGDTPRDADAATDAGVSDAGPGRIASLDPAFGTGGVTVFDSGSQDWSEAVLAHSSGFYFTCGLGAVDMIVNRFTPSGMADTSFGANGQLTVDFGDDRDMCRHVVEDAMGDLLLAGRTYDAWQNFALARMDVDGNLDSIFGTAGLVEESFATQNDDARAVVQLADGSLLATGQAQVVSGAREFAIMRFTGAGTLDTGFASGGRFQDAVSAASTDSYGLVSTLTSDESLPLGGYVTVGGDRDLGVIRIDSAGDLITAFSGDGRFTFDFGGGDGNDSVGFLHENPDGSILVGGSATSPRGNADCFVGRLTASGAIDASFGVAGFFLYDFAGGDDFCVDGVVDGQGRIILVGSAIDPSGSNDRDGAFLGVLPDGRPDPAFGSNGWIVVAAPRNGEFFDVTFDSMDRLVAAGRQRDTADTAYDVLLARVLP